MKSRSLQLLVIGFCGHLVLFPAVAGQKGKAALGSGLGGAAGAVIGKQLGWDTGAVIGGALAGVGEAVNFVVAGRGVDRESRVDIEIRAVPIVNISGMMRISPKPVALSWRRTLNLPSETRMETQGMVAEIA